MAWIIRDHPVRATFGVDVGPAGDWRRPAGLTESCTRSHRRACPCLVPVVLLAVALAGPDARVVRNAHRTDPRLRQAPRCRLRVTPRDAAHTPALGDHERKRVGWPVSTPIPTPLVKEKSDVHHSLGRV